MEDSLKLDYDRVEDLFGDLDQSLTNLSDMTDDDHHENNDILVPKSSRQVSNSSVSVRDVDFKSLNNINYSSSNSDKHDSIISKLESMSKIKTPSKNSLSSNNLNNLKDSVKSAEKITKTIFDTTNSKLSMEIFNNINFDEILENVNSKSPVSRIRGEEKTVEDSNHIKNSSTRILNDENVLKKLGELSMQYSSKSAQENTNENIKNIALSNDFMNNALKMIENELKVEKNEQKTELTTDEIMTQELKKFLNSHNIKDGNLVETRRIDLRASQNMPPNTKLRIYSKQNAESLFQDILINDAKNSLIETKKKNNKIKFLNDKSGSSSSDSSSSGDEQENNSKNSLLWIEQYRKHKRMASNKK